MCIWVIFLLFYLASSRKAWEILFINWFLSCSFWFYPTSRFVAACYLVALGRTEISTFNSGMLLSCILSLHLWVHSIINSCITHQDIAIIGICGLLVIISSLIVEVILIAIRIIISLLVLSSLSLVRITTIVFRHVVVRTVILIIILCLSVFIEQLRVDILIDVVRVIIIHI